MNRKPIAHDVTFEDLFDYVAALRARYLARLLE